MRKKLLALLLALMMILCMMGTAAAWEASTALCSSMDEVRQYISDLTFMLAGEIEFACTDELFSKLTVDKVDVLMFNNGSCDRKVTRNEKTKTITVKNIKYYQGFRIAQAWELGMTQELLTDEELATLRVAQEIVDKICAGKNIGSGEEPDIDLLIALHDELCSRITYDLGDEEWKNQNSAVGALLYGRAKCDGYADAFYLLATLTNSGIVVGIQLGKCGDSSHAWNLVGYKGKMYHMDVSWDDLAGENYRTYAYFMVGSEMFEDHTWAEECVAYNNIASYNNWEACYYTCDGNGEKYGAYVESVSVAADYAAYMKKKGSKQIHVMVDGEHNFEELSSALGKCRAWSGRYAAYTRKMGGYTCYTIIVN